MDALLVLVKLDLYEAIIVRPDQVLAGLVFDLLRTHASHLTINQQ